MSEEPTAMRPLAATIRTQVELPLQFADGYTADARVFSFDGLVDGREHLAFALGDRTVPHSADDRRVPLIIGGGGPRSTLPIVARYADYWNMTTNSVEVFRARSERLSELCRAAGRNPAEIQRSVAVGYRRWS